WMGRIRPNIRSPARHISARQMRRGFRSTAMQKYVPAGHPRQGIVSTNRRLNRFTETGGCFDKAAALAHP
ncbi:hypothetical protein LAN33_26960, partial [Mycobacterium tuberculosis]|nr:hypothetical protein [Mycobacterium tuberculosis]